MIQKLIYIIDNNSFGKGISGKAFFIGKTSNGKDVHLTSIKELLDLCKNAIDEFS